MGRRISSYAILAAVTVGSLGAAAVEAAVRDIAGSLFPWLGAAALGGLGLAVLALRDIRRLRRDAEILAASRERLSELLDVTPVGIAFFDSDGRLEWCNAYCRSLGSDDDMRLALGFHGSGSRPLVVSERRLADGRWVAARRTDLPDGGFISLASDITGDKEREATLDGRVELLRLCLSAAGDWIWETDVLHRVANVTPLRADIDPAVHDWMVGHHLADLAPAADGKGGTALTACLRDMDARQELDNVIVRFHDGTLPRNARLSGIPAFDELGMFLGYRGLGTFVSTLIPERDRSDVRDEAPVAADFAETGDPAGGRPQDVDPRMPRLLVAEDSQTNRMLAAAILRRIGYAADLVEDGRQAVEAVRNTDYGAVLMDVEMPGMDGLEATAVIRGLPAPKNAVPIVAMTAHVDASDRQRCLDAGMDEHLEKPIDRSRLAAVLRDLVGEGHVLSAGIPAADAAPATERTSAADEIDDAVIEQLKVDAGPEIVAELIVTYMAETDERLGRMSEAVEAGRLEDVAGDAHAMKSSSGTFGAIQLQMLAARIEMASANREARQVEAMLAELPTLVSKTWQAFASRGFSAGEAG